MATKHITDLQVMLAYFAGNAARDARLAGIPGAPAIDVFAILSTMTGQCEKVCYRACERALGRGLLDYGINLRGGFMTAKGKELLATATIEEARSALAITVLTPMVREFVRPIVAQFVAGLDLTNLSGEMFSPSQPFAPAPPNAPTAS